MSRSTCAGRISSAAAFGLLLTAFGGMAHAAPDANRGKTLYESVIVAGQKTCGDSACHIGVPRNYIRQVNEGRNANVLKASFTSIGEMTFLRGKLTDAQINDLAAYIATNINQPATYLPETNAPAVSLSATSIAFGNVTTGTTSSRTITVTNSGTAALSISAVSSSNAALFPVSANTCLSGTVAAAGTCSFVVGFNPTTASSASSTISLTSNATGSPHTVAATGAGTAAATGVLGWSGGVTSLTVPATTVGTPSASASLTLQNTGGAAATLNPIAAAGTDPNDFDLSGTCISSTTLAAGASCTVLVTVSSSSAGSKTATLQVNASNATNPPAIALSGTVNAATGGGTTPPPADSGNAGGGGCTLGSPDAPHDPIWALMLALAGTVLGARAWQRRRRLSAISRGA